MPMIMRILTMKPREKSKKEIRLTGPDGRRPLNERDEGAPVVDGRAVDVRALRLHKNTILMYECVMLVHTLTKRSFLNTQMIRS